MAGPVPNDVPTFAETETLPDRKKVRPVSGILADGFSRAARLAAPHLNFLLNQLQRSAGHLQYNQLENLRFYPGIHPFFTASSNVVRCLAVDDGFDDVRNRGDGTNFSEWLFGAEDSSMLVSQRGHTGLYESVTNPGSPDSIRDAVFDRVFDAGAPRWIAVGQNGLLMVTSNFATIGWGVQASAATETFNAVAVGDPSSVRLFVAVGNADGTDAEIFTSNDGTGWVERANPLQEDLNDVAWDPDAALFCAVGNDAGGGTPYILTSPDGSAWTQRDISSIVDTIGGDNLECVAFGRQPDGTGVLVAGGNADRGGGGSNEPMVLYSTDGGINWSKVANPPHTDSNTVYKDVEYINGRFVVVGYTNAGSFDYGEIASSFDGVTWRGHQFDDNAWSVNASSAPVRANKVRPMVVAGDQYGIVVAGAIESPSWAGSPSRCGFWVSPGS